MADDHVIERGTIVVDGSRIACVGDCDTSSADRVVDVSGKTIIPGLLDVHAHHLTFAGNSFIPPQRRHESARYLVYSVTTTHNPSADIARGAGHVAVGAHGEVDGLGAHWEMWALGEAMTPLEALKAGTISAARFIGLEQDIGSIKVGKIADLAVLDNNPLDDIRLSSEVSLVMVGGNLFDARTLRQTWPIERDYGPPPWANDDITRTDVRADDYWDRRPSGEP